MAKSTKSTPVAAVTGGMFASAAALPTKVKVAAKSSDRKCITLPGVERIANLDAIVKAATAVMATSKAELNDTVWAEFLAVEGDKRPDSFNAVEGLAEVNMQMRKKGANVALKDGEVAILREAGVEPHKDTKVMELFAINPDYVKDAALLAQVEKALATIKGLPKDFIVKQQEVTTYVVTDAVADAVWQTRDPEAIKVCSILGMAPRLARVDTDAITATVRELFDIEEPDVEKLLAKLEADSKAAAIAATTKAAARTASFKAAKAAKAAAAVVAK